MKNIFLAILFLASSKVVAGSPESIGAQVNNVISLALSLDEAKLKDTSGNYACQSLDGDIAYDKSVEFAESRAVLLCIRKLCGTIEADVNAEIARIARLSPSAIADLAAGAGNGAYAYAIIELLKSGGAVGSTNCLNPQNLQARYSIYDMCSLNPYTCGKVKRKKH